MLLDSNHYPLIVGVNMTPNTIENYENEDDATKNISKHIANRNDYPIKAPEENHQKHHRTSAVNTEKEIKEN